MHVERNETDLRDELADRSLEEIGRVAGVPFAEAVVEFELHKVAGDGGEEHEGREAIYGVVELEDLVVARPTFPDSEALIPR